MLETFFMFLAVGFGIAGLILAAVLGYMLLRFIFGLFADMPKALREGWEQAKADDAARQERKKARKGES